MDKTRLAAAIHAVVAAFQAIPDDPIVVPPPPPVEPPKPARRINIGRFTRYEYVTDNLRVAWKDQKRADWTDRDGVKQGGNHYATMTVLQTTPQGWHSITGEGMTALARALVKDNTGIHFGQATNYTPAKFGGEGDVNRPRLLLTRPDGSVFDAPLKFAFLKDTNYSGRASLGLRTPGMLKFDLSGFTGEVASAELKLYLYNVYVIYGPMTITINYLDTPFVDPLPFIDTPRNAPDIVNLDMSSEAAIRASIAPAGSSGVMVPPYVYHPEHLRDPRGFDVLRAGYDPSNWRCMAWHSYLKPEQYVDEMYVGFTHRIEKAYWDHQAEAGNKLSGPDTSDGWYCVLWHTQNIGYQRDEENPYLWGLTHYCRDVDHPNGQFVTDAWCVLEADRDYHFEMRVKANTPGMRNGVMQVWVNGHLVFEVFNRQWTASSAPKMTGVFWQLYAGGANPDYKPRAPSWIRCSHFQASTKRIGVPPEFLTAR